MTITVEDRLYTPEEVRGLIKKALEEPILYDSDDASAMLAGMYAPEVLRRKSGAGLLDHTRHGRKILWSRKNLEAIVEKNLRQAANFGRPDLKARTGH